MIITIDGPSGTGKSTVARLLANELNFSFFDTGAMYRSLVFWIRLENLDVEDLGKLKQSLERFSFSIQEEGGVKKYFVSGIDVTEEIRKKEISEAVSEIAAIKEIRDFLLPVQREYASSHDSVFEGRDLGTVVFPKAEVKFFLTANEKVRGERRYAELLAKNKTMTQSLEEVIDSLNRRDEQDSSREIAPLKCPEDAIVVDTSDCSIEEVVEILLKHTLTKKK